jgi:thiamine biosynthesis lipoprotein
MLFQSDFKAMGSPCVIQCFATSQHTANNVFMMLKAEVARLEQKYSRYLPDSLLSTINRAAGSGQAVAIDAETHSILQFAQQAYALSDGLFDITSGVLRQAWDFNSATMPTAAQLQALLPLIGWAKVQWNQRQIVLPQPGMELDFGGIVKEYAADRCVALLGRQKCQGMVNLGGDIAVTPGSHIWDIGIRHPRKGVNDKIASIPLTRGAIAASGDYERCMVLNGKRYNHILNPKTGYPIEGLATACIWAERCVLAGTLTTIAMLQGNKGLEWLKSLKMPYVAVDSEMNIHR